VELEFSGLDIEFKGVWNKYYFFFYILLRYFS
jgi:hypothetical protein